MSSYIPIHGAWCWQRVTPSQQDADHVDTVIAVDLLDSVRKLHPHKAQGEISNVDYIDAVVNEIESADLDSVILVGHSMAGINVPVVVTRVPNRIKWGLRGQFT